MSMAATSMSDMGATSMSARQLHGISSVLITDAPPDLPRRAPCQSTRAARVSDKKQRGAPEAEATLCLRCDHERGGMYCSRARAPASLPPAPRAGR